MKNTTITSLFHYFLGNKFEQTQKEKAEYLKAKLSHDELLEEKEIIEKQKLRIKQRKIERLKICVLNAILKRAVNIRSLA